MRNSTALTLLSTLSSTLYLILYLNHMHDERMGERGVLILLVGKGEKKISLATDDGVDDRSSKEQRYHQIKRERFNNLVRSEG